MDNKPDYSLTKAFNNGWRSIEEDEMDYKEFEKKLLSIKTDRKNEGVKKNG